MTDTFLILCLAIILFILIIRNLVLKQKAEFLKKINEELNRDLEQYIRRDRKRKQRNNKKPNFREGFFHF